MPSDDELKILRISTAAFPDRDSVEEFREVFGRTILRIDMEPLSGAAFEADMMLRAIPGLGVASGELSPMRNRHNADLIDNDDLVLVIMRSGAGTVEQNGRATDVHAGEVALTANGETATFTGHSRTQVINLRLSRDMLSPSVPDLGGHLLAPIVKDGPALQMLKRYAEILNDAPALATAELRRAVAIHMHDLAILALGARGDAAAVAAARGVRAARLHAIKRDVLDNLARHDLSVAAVAARQGVTTRYVHLLFEGEELSFSEFVLAQRLARAHRRLTDPRLGTRKISAIAYEVGFGDLSYFNRSFRRRYGATPSEVRDAKPK